jgi:hypothetical protein
MCKCKSKAPVVTIKSIKGDRPIRSNNTKLASELETLKERHSVLMDFPETAISCCTRCAILAGLSAFFTFKGSNHCEGLEYRVLLGRYCVKICKFRVSIIDQVLKHSVYTGMCSCNCFRFRVLFASQPHRYDRQSYT